MNTKFFTILTLTAAIAACSSTPDRNSALDQARADFASAQSNPQVTTLAADELKQAGDSLRLTESAWKKGEEKARINHLAYMTVQRVTIAEETAANRAHQETTAGAAAERDKMRLAMRTNEADTAKQQLALSERNNEIKAAELSALEQQLKDLNAKKTERGLVVTLGDVLFDTGESVLLANSALNMSKLAEAMKNNPETTASIEGHTDSVGNPNSNHALSQRRADAVMTALINLGVPSANLSTRAHGAEVPAADNTTAAGRQMNRRVEVVFAQ